MKKKQKERNIVNGFPKGPQRIASYLHTFTSSLNKTGVKTYLKPMLTTDLPCSLNLLEKNYQFQETKGNRLSELHERLSSFDDILQMTPPENCPSLLHLHHNAIIRDEKNASGMSTILVAPWEQVNAHSGNWVYCAFINSKMCLAAISRRRR